MSGPAVIALLAWPPLTYLVYAIIGLVCVLVLRKIGLIGLVAGKLGLTFASESKSSMMYVRAMLNVDRQKQYADQKCQQEARRRTRNMVDIITSHVMAAEMIELRQYIGEADSRWRDLAFRALLRGEVKDEIMTKTMEIYELNGLGGYSEVELQAKIDRDFRSILPSVSDIIRDGWANPDITWDQLFEVLQKPEHKAPIKAAFGDCVKEFRGLALRKAVEYAKIDDLIVAIEMAAEKGGEIPKGCFEDGK